MLCNVLFPIDAVSEGDQLPPSANPKGMEAKEYEL